MVSKLLSLQTCKSENSKLKTFDFVHYYKSATEQNTALKKDSIDINNDPFDASNTSVRRQLLGKIGKKKSKGERVIVTKVDIDGQNLVSSIGHTSPASGSKIASTPNLTKKKIKNIKSIKKEEPSLENSLDLSHVPNVNRKKRNKSVSFMLEDNDEVVVKKTKSDKSLISKTENGKHKVKKNKDKKQLKEDKENDLKIDIIASENKVEVLDKQIKSGKSFVHTIDKNNLKNNKKRLKKQIMEEKENDLTTDNDPFEHDIEKPYDKTENKKKETILKKLKRGKTIKKNDVNNVDTGENTACTVKEDMTGVDVPIMEKPNIKKKRRKHSKVIQDFKKAGPTDTNSSNNTKQNSDSIMIIKKSKRPRKNKQNGESDVGEPEKKSFKKSKSDSIAEGIENLNIGDNAHTLTNLLDGMTVTKTKNKGNKKEKEVVLNPDKISEDKPKPNQNNRRRKNRKTNAAVLVQNLPFRILLSYKQKLREFFSKYGTVQSIGIADLKCNQDIAQPIFTTRVFYKNEEEATAALDGNNELFEGNIISVKKFKVHASRTFRPSSWVNRNSSRNQSEGIITDKSIEERGSDNNDSD